MDSKHFVITFKSSLSLLCYNQRHTRAVHCVARRLLVSGNQTEREFCLLINTISRMEVTSRESDDTCSGHKFRVEEGVQDE